MSDVTRAGAITALVVSTLVVPVLDARAEPAADPATQMMARELGKQALQHFEDEEFELALEKFTRANQLLPAPTLAVRAARCLVELNRWVEAAERYLQVIQMELPVNAKAVHRQAKVEAQREREELLPRIPQLFVYVDGPVKEIHVDDKTMPLAGVGQAWPADPGTHRVEVSSGRETVSQEVTLEEGKRADVRLKLAPIAAPKPPREESMWPRLGWIGVASGGTALLIGVTHSFVALAQEQSLIAECPDRQCPESSWGASDTYDVVRVSSTVGFIAGGVLGAAGVAILVFDPGGDRKPRVEAGLALPGAVIRATF